MTKNQTPQHRQDVDDVVSFVDDILEQALARGASDIHFEPTGSGLEIRFRLDGLLQPVETLPASMAETVVGRLKVLAGLLTYRNDIPQEGRLDIDTDDHGAVSRRVATFPTIHGQRAVVRLFYDEPRLNELENLGLPETVFDTITGVIDGTQGMLLLSGPAGSGKSTTLAACLRHIHRQRPGRSIVSVEDPVERHIEGVTQVQISPFGELTFPVALRSLLRQDPEVLMIGEIRDAETARIACEAALTGHLVLSTLHSGHGAGALVRLLDMGVEPYQVTSSVRAVVNQRLVRLACTRCHGSGCATCLDTGYHGRHVLAEAVRMDGRLRRALLDETDLSGLKALYADEDHPTLRRHGQALADAGRTTTEELDRVLGTD